MRDWSHVRWLAAACLLALVFDLVFYTGYFGSDDAYYTWAAHQIAQRENFLAIQVYENQAAVSRIAFNLPLGFVYWISDGSTTWMCLFQILYHLGCVAVAYALGNDFSGKVASRVASLMVATCPLLYLFAGSMLPDVALAMWSGLYLLVLSRALRRGEEGSWKQRVARFATVGVLLGVTYSIKPTALVLAGPTALAIISAFPSIRRPTWILYGGAVIVGLGVMLLLEWTVLRVARGEWIAGLNTTYAIGQNQADFGVAAQRHGVELTTRMRTVAHELRLNIPYSFPLLAAGVIAHTISSRRRSVLVAFAWFTPLYLAFGTVALTAYVPMPVYPRYYSPIVIPCAVATASAIAYGWEALAPRLSERVRRVTAVVLVALGCLFVALEARANLRIDNSIARAIWVRSFERAYERANEAYPELPIVLPDRVVGMILPMLLPDIAERVYYAGNAPWGDDGKTTPKPPFILLASSKDDPPLLALWSLGDVDLDHVEIVPLEIVKADTAFGVERLAAAAHALFGSEPPDRRTDTLAGWDATTIYLVKPAASTTVRLAVPLTVVAPGVSSNTSISGSSLSWTSKASFAADYFEGGNPFYAPSTRMAELPPGTHEISVALKVHSFGAPVRGIAEVWAYDKTYNPIEWTERKVALSPGEQVVKVTVSSDRELQTYRVRWWFETTLPGALHLDPFETTTSPATSAWIDLTVLNPDPVDVERSGDSNKLVWAASAKRFAIQAFSSQHYRTAPFDSKAQLAADGASVKSFTVTNTLQLLSGSPTVVDVEAFAYDEKGKLVDKQATTVTVDTNMASVDLSFAPKVPVKSYRVRWWFEPKGAGSALLGSPTLKNVVR